MGILGAWVVELGLITYRGFAKGAHWPLPADYAGATIVYGALGLASKTRAAPVATAIGWGFVVATLLNLWTPTHPSQLKSKTKAKT